MSLYTKLKDDLLQINQDISHLLDRAKKMPGMSENSFENWQKTCKNIHRQISEEILRIAVVGAIKSGKSTLVNSLLHGDYLKRGAGVVTSIVTKIRRGERLGAKLYLKSWNEVNSDLQQALVLFPSFRRSSENRPVDIRQPKDRAELQKALDSLNVEYLFTHDARNVNSVLLASYLEGYERVKDWVGDKTNVIDYGPEQFEKHMDFVGDDSMAVYLKDMQLKIVYSALEKNVEIADCQGSDSPNPLHLAMIQDYLLRTHLIIYAISSRTGLRRADIRFLTMIRKMGIMENIIFVVNCDLSEHESLEGLREVIRKTRDDISLIKPEPEVYAFSALYNLFVAQKNQLPQKDTARLNYWKNEKELVDFSDQQTDAFHESFHRKLTSEKYFLLLKNHLERMDTVASGFQKWLGVGRDILARDTASASEITQKVKQHQEGISQMNAVMKSTLDGAVAKLKKDLRKDVDRFFDLRDSDLISRIYDHIQGYGVTFEQIADQLRATGFTNTLYFVFQEFKQGLDSFMTENINPDIIRFIKETEKKIEEQMMLIGRPYDGLIQEALSEYNDTMQDYGLNLEERIQSLELPDMSAIKNQAKISLPPAGTTLHYSAKIQSEAVMRLSYYKVIGLIRKILKRSGKDKTKERYDALRDGIRRMKRETEKSIISHFKDYRENIKFQYVFKLVDAEAEALYDALLNRFQAYATDLTRLVEGIEGHGEAKADAAALMTEMEMGTKNIRKKIEETRAEINEAV